MDWWVILLIVVAVLLFIILVILPAIILPFAGKQMVKMLNRCDSGMKGVKMDVSFYDLGPLKEASKKGLEFMDKQDYEEIYIDSYDGLKLMAYYFKNPNQKGNRIMLGMHGFRSGPRHEYAPYIEKYFSLGYSLLCPCQRAHYKSEGEYITMGTKERYDVVTWCNYIVSRFGSDTKILIQGVSMGAASVCMASALDLPKNVIGIVSDCAYSTFKDQLVYTVKSFKMPAKPILYIMNRYTKKIGLDLNSEGPIDAVRKSKVPILFMHGAKDEIVPVELAKNLNRACTSKHRLYIVGNANHAESEARDPEKYFKVIEEFFEGEL